MCSSLWPIALSCTVFPDAQLLAGTLAHWSKIAAGARARWGGEYPTPTPLGLTVTLRLTRTPGSTREVGAWKGDFHRPWRDAPSQAPLSMPGSAVIPTAGQPAA